MTTINISLTVRNPAISSVLTISQGIAGESGTIIPNGGTTGQVLAKASNVDGDVEWINP